MTTKAFDRKLNVIVLHAGNKLIDPFNGTQILPKEVDEYKSNQYIDVTEYDCASEFYQDVHNGNVVLETVERILFNNVFVPQIMHRYTCRKCEYCNHLNLD